MPIYYECYGRNIKECITRGISLLSYGLTSHLSEEVIFEVRLKGKSQVENGRYEEGKSIVSRE